MDLELENLLEVYANKDKYLGELKSLNDPQQNKKLSLAERFNALFELQHRLDFGKKRQSGWLLKYNDDFLNELSSIKSRLGENFFKILEEVEYDQPGELDIFLRSSDFVEPTITTEAELLATLPLDSNTSDIQLPKDPYFLCTHLDFIVFEDEELEQKNVDKSLRLRKCKVKIFFRYLNKWQEFCVKWNLSIEWSGNIDYLQFQTPPALKVQQDKTNRNYPIVIRLGKWATRDDLEKTWETVERLMQQIGLWREREGEKFLRDLIWFQLNKKINWPPSKIAEYWVSKFPREYDLNILKKAMKKEWQYDEYNDKDWADLLVKIYSRNKDVEEFRTKFLIERSVYLKTGLRERIKKSLAKINKQIKRQGYIQTKTL